MAEELYLRLFSELNDSRFDSDEVRVVLAELGAPAEAFRGFANARRHAWASARADFRAALDRDGGAGEIAPLISWICGAGLFVSRDYSRGLTALGQAAANAPIDDEIGIATRARKLALRLTTALGWSQEARELREAIAKLDIQGAKHLRAHSLELQRQAAIRRRAQQAIEGAPADAARKAYSLLYRDGPAAAAAALDTLLRRHPEHPAVLGARLRLELLLDELEAAEQRAAALSDENTILLRAERAALALAWADASQAMQLTQDPGNDPRLLYLRASAMRLLLEDHSEAAVLLERARVQVPYSVTVNLALAVSRHQNDPTRFDEGLEHRFDQLLEWAPGLLSDAAASLELELWSDQGLVLERPDKAGVLLRAHAMLTAERDLNIATYARRGGDGGLHLRHVAPASKGDTHFARLHRDDDKVIAQNEAVLVWSIGVRPPSPESFGNKKPEQKPSQDDEVWVPRYLSAEQIEQFLADGFIVIHKAFGLEFAREKREAAVQRIREQPEKWVRGYDPERHGGELENFSVQDPSTWGWPRIDLLGPGKFVIERDAPNAWAAMCDLLGGPARIKTREWGDYMIINAGADDPLTKDQPSRHANSWHIDDPSPCTRVDGVLNGLLCVALFDDVLPRSGNTWLAPDSVGLVARDLAAHPEGVDYVNYRGSHITSKCARFHEVVGQAGDIALLHPLMMHSASPNRSGRLRWMTNPMVYLNQPLNPYRPFDELSPVELAMHRAIPGLGQD